MTDAREWLANPPYLGKPPMAERMRDALVAVLDLCEPTAEQYRRSHDCYDEGAMDLAGAIEEAINEALGVNGPHAHQWRGVVDGTSYCVDCGVERDD